MLISKHRCGQLAVLWLLPPSGTLGTKLEAETVKHVEDDHDYDAGDGNDEVDNYKHSWSLFLGGSSGRREMIGSRWWSSHTWLIMSEFISETKDWINNKNWSRKTWLIMSEFISETKDWINDKNWSTNTWLIMSEFIR